MKRKKLMGWKRMAAFAMALSLTLGDGASVGVMAAQASDTKAAVEAAEVTETAETETEAVAETETEAESEAATEKAAASETESETVTEKEAETESETAAEEKSETESETTAEDESEVVEDTEEVTVGAVNGPSKVIGVEGKQSYDTIRTANGDTLKYVYVNQIADGVVVAGTVDTKDTNGNVVVPSSLKDATTGLYKSGDTYYASCSKTNLDGFVKLSKPVVIASGKAESYKDASGMYTVSGKSYTNMSNTPVEGYCYAYVSNEATEIGTTKTYTDARNLMKSYAVKDTDEDVLYYNVNGKYYKGLEYNQVYNSSDDDIYSYSYHVYAPAAQEISFDKTYVQLNWNQITDNTVITNKAGDKLKVGYEVVVNDDTTVYDTDGTFVDATDGKLHKLVTYNAATAPYMVLGAGETANVKVRAVYYHEVKDITKEEYTHWSDDSKYIVESKVTKYVADMYGEWSDPYTYTSTALQVVPAVTGLAATTTATDIKLSWNNVEAASGYTVYSVKSSTPLNITDAASFKQFYSRQGDLYNAYVAANGGEDSYYTDSDYESNNYVTYSGDKENPYCYYAVVANGAAKGYITDGSYSNVASAVFSVAANTPAVQNFKVEKTNNGNGWQLSWTPVNAKVVIYAFEEGKQPEYFNAGMLNAYGYYTDAAGSRTKVTLADELTDAQRAQISKYVRSTTTDGMDGVYSGFSLKPGVKYTFVAYTYDDDATVNKTEKASIATINHEVYVTDAQGNRTYQNVPVNMTYYTAMSAASNVVSYTGKISQPSVTTKAGKNSIKLNMSGSNSTGFEIYRKSGKKYKKIATTTDSVYTDEDLKADTKYSYKVRAYYYDTETKDNSYSEYTVFSATTSQVNNITVKAVKNTKNSVKLTWTKVGAAKKYEIYRTSEVDSDPSVISKQLSSGDYATQLSNAKYQLVKTITKANTTSYTDKKLTAGEDYGYIVMAYYADGKTTKYISSGARVALELTTPRNVVVTNKGSKVTVKWDADKYASKYELKYTVYDKYGKAKTDTAKTASTKKASYTISGLQSGEHVSVAVRAYGTNKTYSSWTSEYVSTSLGVTSSIKAVNDAKTGAVKITWKKVSGAKYYKVYRTTKTPVYNSDEKRYVAGGSLIAKESNDDTGYSSQVYYQEYYGITGSVTGTTAYDYAQLKTGVKYYYTVVAYGEKDTSIASYVSNGDEKSIASGKPAVVTYDAAVDVTLKNSKKGTVTVSYKKVSGAKTYSVYRSDKKNGKYSLVGTSKKTSYTDKKAKKGKTYYYKVVAKGTNALKADFTSESSAVKIKVKK